MATIKFLIKGNKNPSSIYVRLRNGRQTDITTKTKFIVDPKNWSNTKGSVKNTLDESLLQLKEDLEQFKLDLTRQFNKDQNGSIVDANWLKSIVNPPTNPHNNEIPNTIINYYDYYLKIKKTEITKSTETKLKVNKGLFLTFQKDQKKTFLIRDINESFKTSFESFCKKNGYAQNTISKALTIIKTLCYHARNNGIETSYQLDRLSIKKEKVEKIYLTEEELEKISNHNFEHEYLDNARDWLIISCETGQRVSDFIRFSSEMIRKELVAHSQKEIALLEFTQQKTSKRMTIPLSKKVLTILKKRDGEFPRKISSQRYNEYIKEVCFLVGIKQVIPGAVINKKTGHKVKGMYEKYKLISSHVGRRSFATNNYGKIPTALLMSATGHTTEKMFLEYIGKTETDRAHQLAEYLA